MCLLVERCGITLCLVVDARCGSCMQCGAIFNNAQSLPSPEGISIACVQRLKIIKNLVIIIAGSWVWQLLEEHSTCLFCGGHFEQVM